MTEPKPPPPSFDPRTWVETQGRRASEHRSEYSGAATQNFQHNHGIIARLAVAAALVAVLGALLLVLKPLKPAPPVGRGPAAPETRRTLSLASLSNLDSVLTAAGVPARDAASAVSVERSAFFSFNEGPFLVAITTLDRAGGRGLASLEVRAPSGDGVRVEPSVHGGFRAMPLTASLRTTIRIVRGEMDGLTFYSSAVAQHLDDTLIVPFAKALSFDFDFQREIHAGDIFEAAVEERVGTLGRRVGEPRLIYVGLTTPTKSRSLYWFQPRDGPAGWYDGDGRSAVRALMRTPVEGAHVSSTFGMREHPILGFMKMHEGVDFAAPVGTPIFAAGAGVIVHAEAKALDGNYVEILHPNGWRTFYLHMNRFARGVVPGMSVTQGQVIGEVGETGRSTGPHLHFGLKIGDAFVDPMMVKVDSGIRLTAGARGGGGGGGGAFLRERDQVDRLRGD